MKKTLCVLLCLIAGFNIVLLAQNKMQEVVYLKNGGMIKGMIVEVIPGQSLKIQTCDGSIFVYSIDEVSKITKESVSRNNHHTSSSHHSDVAGYRGFVDFGYTIGTGTYYNAERLELSTSYGYQFNPYLFVGGGVGLNYYTNAELASFPIFADVRANFTQHTFVPFATLKIGYAVGGDIYGFYLAPAVGVKYKLSEKKALNLTLGYTYQGFQDEWYDYRGKSVGSSTENLGGVSIKIGFEF
jgi:hypothetical protein